MDKLDRYRQILKIPLICLVKEDLKAIFITNKRLITNLI